MFALLAAGAAAATAIPRAGADPNCAHSQSWQCDTTTTTPTTSTTPPPAGPCGSLAAQTPPATYAHVVWIWMENKSYSEIIGSSAASYENDLAQSCGLATNYFGVAHPSLPNYIAATSGSTQGITDDAAPASHPLSVASIFGQTTSGSYEESMPTNCDLVDAYPYAVKHNPEAYYTLIQSDCQTHDVPLSAFDPNNLPQFSFVTPNLCNDTHDCSVATGDTWLQNFVPQIIRSADYQAGRTAVFITWDEDDGSSTNHVPLIVLSQYTPPGTSSGMAANHYSLLRTSEQLLGITTVLGAAATATSLRSDFHLGINSTALAPVTSRRHSRTRRAPHH
jgi:hypothetical protein